MCSRVSSLVVLILVIIPGFSAHAAITRPDPHLIRIEVALLSGSIHAPGLRYDSFWLRAVYDGRQYTPVWMEAGRFPAEADSLVTALQHAYEDGLNPADYDADELARLLRDLREGWPAAGDPERTAAQADVLLTNAFLHFASDLHSGRLDPEVVTPDWSFRRRTMDLGAVLGAALDGQGVQGALQSIRPSTATYRQLKQVLAACRIFSSADPGVSPIPGDVRVLPGDSSLLMPLVREHLRHTGDYELQGASGSMLYDSALAAAVRRFQTRHGIEPDGIIGRATVAALNTPTDRRIRQIEANLERLRWEGDDEGSDQYVRVNIPAYELDVVESGKTAMTTRVVVGRPASQTPVFSDVIQYVVLSPVWNVPPAIAEHEILPQVLKNPGYLGTEHIRVYQTVAGETVERMPDSVDWSGFNTEEYRFVMDPGVNNALGRVKFIFPNQNNVYIHDTPSRSAFRQATRNLSHGCVRTDRPLDLAEHLLQSDSGWTRRSIDDVIKRGEETPITLSHPVPVHIVYYTAWVGEDGAVQFRDDIYNRDASLWNMLHQRPAVVTQASHQVLTPSPARMSGSASP